MNEMFVKSTRFKQVSTTFVPDCSFHSDDIEDPATPNHIPLF